MSERAYHVVLEPDRDGGYVVVVPAFPGCYSQGETVEEALANVKEAIALTIDDMLAHGEVIPRRRPEVGPSREI
jgi:antitoxin HicB